MAQAVVASDVGAAIIAAAANGDASALERIIVAHHADLARVCVVICGGDPDLADDAVQIAWSIAWRKLRGLRDPERLRPWLVAIAANEARRLVRSPRARVVEIDLEQRPAATDPAERWASIDLRNAVLGLRVEDRTILALRHVVGLDSTEISRIVGMSPSGVRSRLERILARLRTELGDD
jgi:RNA polymerase sigma factor (sigma-70 family)